MKLKCPKGTVNINVAGVEYDADTNGLVTITDERHIEAALKNGFTKAPPAVIKQDEKV